MKKYQIEEYLNYNFLNSKFIAKLNKNKKFEYKIYLKNSIYDAVSAYNILKKDLKKKDKILEIGGGCHFLSIYLDYLGYDVTSIEPSKFDKNLDYIRKLVLKKKSKNLKIFTKSLEYFKSVKNFDYVFSINVLEHTKNIKIHINRAMQLLKNNGKLRMRCPNYTFPYESHFNIFLIPFFYKFSIQKLYKKNLVKKFGNYQYKNIKNNLNFSCNYFFIKLNFKKAVFKNPIIDVFDRLNNDQIFYERVLSNKVIKIIYDIINILKLKKIIYFLYPKFLYPYMDFRIKND